MIVVAIGIVFIAVILMGLFIQYADDRDQIQQSQEQAAVTQNERVREEFTMMMDKDGAMMEGSMSMQGEPKITGVMVECGNGKRFTGKMDSSVDMSDSSAVMAATQTMVDDLRCDCPQADRPGIICPGDIVPGAKNLGGGSSSGTCILPEVENPDTGECE